MSYRKSNTYMIHFWQKVFYSMLALKCQALLNIKYNSIILYDILCRLALLCEYFLNYKIGNVKTEEIVH